MLLEALAKVPVDDALTAEKLLGLLLAQPADALRKERAAFSTDDRDRVEPAARVRGAYAALS